MAGNNNTMGQVGSGVVKTLVGMVLGSGSSTPDSTTNGNIDPVITVKKTASFPTSATTTVDYTVVVENSKNAQSAYYTVLADTLYNPEGKVVYERSWPLQALVPGDQVTLSYSVAFPKNTNPGIYRNVARITGQRNDVSVKDQIIKMPAVEGWAEVQFTEVIPQVLGASTIAPTACTPLLRTDMGLRLRNNPEEVKKLQQFLNTSSETRVASSGPGSPGNESGSYGALTVTAVKKFQQKYASEILTPLGLKAPTGSVYGATRAKINALACGTVSSVPATPAPFREENKVEQATAPLQTARVEETKEPVPAKPKYTPKAAERPAASGTLFGSIGSFFSKLAPKNNSGEW